MAPLHKRPISGTAVLLFLLLSACSLLPVKIADIKAHPDRFENKTVTVRGKVTSVTKMPFMTEGFFTLDDGSGEITVTTSGALPAEGQERTVTGKVQTALKIFDKHVGLVIQENP
ncbi:MAG: hypothetical protein WBS54_01425 [Acidobacteriota bacterium]